MSSGDSRELRDEAQHQCILCNQPNHADRKMVQCDGCDRWFHFRCVGANDSIEDPDRSFRCTACTVPDPPGSTASTSASIREARIQLEVQRLAEEKRLREKVQAEREKQERDLQEMTLRFERERRDKAVKEMFALEKEYIQKKYDLLHTQFDDDDAGSIRSRCNRETGRVEAWITQNPAVIMSANTGNTPTGLTSQLEAITDSVQMLAAASTAVSSPHHISAFSSSAIPSSSAVVPNPLSCTSNAPIPQTAQQLPTNNTTTHGIYGSPTATSAVSVPSTLANTNNMFVISPTTTAVSFSLPAFPSQPASCLQTMFLQPLSSQPPLPQTASSSYRAGTAHTMVASCLPSGGIPSLRQQSSYVSMPPPSHHSTPASVSWERRPTGELYAYNTHPVRSQEIQRNTASVSVNQLSLHPGLGEITSSVAGQYVQPATGVSNNYGMHDTRNLNQNCAQNYWLPGANQIPLQTSRQLENISNNFPVPHIGGNTGQWGYQGIQTNQSSVPLSQHIPRGSQVTFFHGGGFNADSQSMPAVPVCPPIPPDHGPSMQQIAARHVVSRELPTFDGNPAEWPLFWSSYCTSTQMCGYSGAENLLRLQRCLKGDARKAVSSFLLHPSNVDDILSTLRTLFGRPDVIINTLLNDVRSTPAPKPEKLETLVNFGLVVRNLCAHLVSAGQDVHLANPVLLQELVEKLPANIKLGWAMHKQTVAVADLRMFADYMNVIINAASSVTSVLSGSPKTERQKGNAFVHSVCSENSNKSDQYRSEKGGTSGEASEESSVAPKVRPCAVCQIHGHKPKDCSTFKGNSLSERWKIVQDAHLCRRCLYPHGKWPCKAPVCGTDGCQENHHKFLHPGNPHATNNPGSSTPTSTSGVVTVHQHLHQRVLFRIIPVCLHANGKSVDTFAFLDGGSDSTLLESSVAEKLELNGAVVPLCMQWTNGVRRTEEDSKSVQLEISGSSGKRFPMSGVHTVSSLDLPLQTLDFDELQDKFPHLKGLPIASYADAVPGILIGLDNTMLKSTLKLREGDREHPVAAKTRLGWVLYGRAGESDPELLRRVFHVCYRPTNDNLHDLVKSFFTVEGSGVGSNEIVESMDEKRAREIMKATTVRTKSGKFQTGLLWKYELVEFPDSKPMAVRRLQCLEKRLSKDPELYDKVRQQIADYLTKGYAHKATEQELVETNPKQTWYLPLGVVTNPKKPEKLRVVWDAAATVKGVSLNSVLLKGPDLLQSLPTVLCRFRQREVAINADIKEMFHQVLIRPEDRQAQRFLWRNKPSEAVEVFVMDVAVFGSTCSPSSAQFAKNLNAQELSRQFPKAAIAVVENHYVDDYLDSVDTIDEAVELATEVKAVHEHAGFQLRHWLSNSTDVLRQIGEEPSDAAKNFVMGKDGCAERVLGMIWLPIQDVFTFAIQFREDLKRLLDGNVQPTKRELLSLIMSIFDPLGLVANFVVHGKILVQEVWRSGIGWDDKIPDELFASWHRWVLALHSLSSVRISRCYFPGYDAETLKTLELHVFVDASLGAYAAAAYFRVIQNGTIRCCLVSSKTKVAPIKQLSVPRLELQAAVLGTRLLKTVVSSHTLLIGRKILWSDSNTVLAWLRADQRRFQQFVAFRIGEILESTDNSDWRKVPSKWNVSDEATKWGNGPNASEGSRWLHGPEFLYRDESEWPSQEEQWTTTEEIRTTVSVHRSIVSGIIQFERFSKWKRLVRAVGYVWRFWNNCQKKKDKLPYPDSENLTSTELQLAEQTVLKLVQREAFPKECTMLESMQRDTLHPPKQVDKNSRIYQLSPFLSADGLIRKDGRIGAAVAVAEDAKFPVILPRDHYVTKLIIDEHHCKFSHANNETIVNELRQRFHIPKLRIAVGKVARNCGFCKVRKAAPQPPRMGPLPEARLTPYIRAFTFTGLDYFGPVIVRIGRKNVKRWAALFTCLTTRAVHLEVAFTLSTESCKLAVRRFIARRGAPLEIYSDQGLNFQGARKELREEIQRMNKELASTFTNAATQWKFNPPYAPHMGGIWERLVRSVKIALAAMETYRNPDDETFLTALAEAESIVNSRPLTYLPLDSAESEALTPNHFLLLSSNGVCQPVASPVDVNSALRANWDHVRVMLDRFWSRWVKEYLPVIARQTKWFCETKPVQVGDLVIVVDESKRNCWERGVIVKVYSGKDGRIRSADVRTTAGIFHRPVTKLAILDVLEKSGMAEGLTSSNTGRGMCATVQDPPLSATATGSTDTTKV